MSSVVWGRQCFLLTQDAKRHRNLQSPILIPVVENPLLQRASQPVSSFPFYQVRWNIWRQVQETRLHHSVLQNNTAVLCRECGKNLPRFQQNEKWQFLCPFRTRCVRAQQYRLCTKKSDVNLILRRINHKMRSLIEFAYWQLVIRS